jgi:hypothetical protein
VARREKSLYKLQYVILACCALSMQEPAMITNMFLPVRATALLPTSPDKQSIHTLPKEGF